MTHRFPSSLIGPFQGPVGQVVAFVVAFVVAVAATVVGVRVLSFARADVARGKSTARRINVRREDPST
jgi:hypothetical protein